VGKKLTAVVHHYYPAVGGAELSLHKNLSNLVKKGYECRVLCFMDNDSRPFSERREFNIDGVEVIQCKFPTEKTFIQDSVRNTDVIITMLTMSPIIVPYCREMKKPIINIACDEICFSNGNIVNSLLYSNIVLANSEYTQKRLKIKGVDSRIFFPDFNRYTSNEKCNKKHILFFNPRKHKGHDIVKDLVSRFDKYNFVIAGSDGYDVWTKKNVEKLEANNVQYVGNIERAEVLDNLYREAIVTLVPSQVPETFSMVAAESIWRNTPVIASRFGALPDTVGKCGIIVSEYTNPSSWMIALHSFMESKPTYNFDEQKTQLDKYSSLEILEQSIEESIRNENKV